MVNLDELPTCVFEGQEYPSKQATKGVYYIELNLSSEEYEPDTMYYDLWTNIKYNGRQIKDTELQFVTKASDGYFSFGLPAQPETSDKFIPSLSGINFKEQIKRGDIRKVNVECKIPYTSNQMYAVENIEYRLYVMDGVRQIDVIDYSPIERLYNTNYFLINTNDLIPSRYYIDLKVRYGMEEIYHRDVLHFDIMNDLTEVYN
jgi:hypothetical protein